MTNFKIRQPYNFYFASINWSQPAAHLKIMQQRYYSLDFLRAIMMFLGIIWRSNVLGRISHRWLLHRSGTLSIYGCDINHHQHLSNAYILFPAWFLYRLTDRQPLSKGHARQPPKTYSSPFYCSIAAAEYYHGRVTNTRRKLASN